MEVFYTNYYTTDLYETKREIVNFSKKISESVNKSTSKFVMDMIYGISKSKSCLISEISRSLKEKINLNYTIERLCDNLNNIKEEEIKIIKENYLNEIEDLFEEEPISIFDDSDIAKPYRRKFEDLDKVIDASSIEGKVRMKLWFDDNEKYEVYVSHTRVTLPYKKKNMN